MYAKVTSMNEVVKLHLGSRHADVAGCLASRLAHCQSSRPTFWRSARVFRYKTCFEEVEVLYHVFLEAIEAFRSPYH